MMQSERAAFTLIELLVVITIIVVLLALLTPALDKAIYQAELTVCGAKQRAVAGAVLLYAAAHKRHYPYRPGVAGGAWRPNQYTTTYTDERDLFRDYIEVNGMLNCPLTQEVDMETSDITWIWGPTYLWFGWRYSNPAHKGMKKIGDRFNWTADFDGNGVSETAKFRILVGDEDQLNRNDNWAISSHPDTEGRMAQQVMQDGGGYAQNVPPDIGRYANNNWTLSRWIGPWARGPVDINWGYDDGSVLRLNKIEHENDGRVLRVPVMSNGTNPNWENNLPRE